MWELQIQCIAAMFACLANAAPQPATPWRPFETRAECEAAADAVARQWRPGSAAYVFRCNQVPQKMSYRMLLIEDSPT